VSVEAFVKRDRFVAAAGLAGVTLLAWAWLVRMGGMDMGTALRAFSPSLTFLMWAVMMVGMMLPSAALMILVFAALNRRRAERGGAAVATWIFAVGYLLAWIVMPGINGKMSELQAALGLVVLDYIEEERARRMS
jgi:predicted metal-binding membrane protein